MSGTDVTGTTATAVKVTGVNATGGSAGAAQASVAKARFYLAPRGIVTLSAIALAGLAVRFAPVTTAQPQAMTGLAIVLIVVALFATQALPGMATSAIFFALALGTGVVPPMTIAAGFWSNATMLIFGGLVIGAAAERSGLGRYVARGLMLRFAGTYPMFLFGILTGALALSFIVPSTMGRLAITIPIVMAVAKEAGYAPDSNGYAATILTAVAGNFTTSYAILPANLVNVIVLGAAENIYGPQLQYAEYLWLCGPVLGIVKGLTFMGLILLLFPAPAPLAPETSEPLLISRAGKRLAILLGVTVLFWATDALHGLKPGWVALAAGLLCLLPPIALVGLRESFDLNRLTGVISVPVMLGVAAVLTYSGAGRLIAETIMSIAPLAGHTPAFGFVAMTLISSLAALIATTVGAIAIVTPLIAEIATATGLPVKLGIIAELTGLQSIFFHFEAVPVMVGLAMGRLPVATATRMLVPFGLTGLLVVLPMMVLWLKLLGALP